MKLRQVSLWRMRPNYWRMRLSKSTKGFLETKAQDQKGIDFNNLPSVEKKQFMEDAKMIQEEHLQLAKAVSLQEQYQPAAGWKGWK